METAIKVLHIINVYTLSQTSISAIAERLSCRVGQLWLKVEGWETTLYGHYSVGLSSTTMT